MSSELVEHFRQVTGTDEETALSFLSACNNNLDMAVSLYMDESNIPRTTTPDEEYRSPIPQRTEQLLPVELPMCKSLDSQLIYCNPQYFFANTPV
ncbi:hypothetical protein P879_09752 [Paragonimus westermani]|uniref:UBX domain-containing protein n=1 Tax=Paragonimus westermani TaxID=34504 RepID=A0A8T0DCR4_9TREM|nr:hypothetical protein P879_09752 [Paragonimus westermani]